MFLESEPAGCFLKRQRVNASDILSRQGYLKQRRTIFNIHYDVISAARMRRFPLSDRGLRAYRSPFGLRFISLLFVVCRCSL